MSNNLFKAICFCILAITLFVARILNVSVYTTGLTVFCIVVLVGLAIFFFVRYRREEKK